MQTSKDEAMKIEASEHGSAMDRSMYLTSNLSVAAYLVMKGADMVDIVKDPMLHKPNAPLCFRFNDLDQCQRLHKDFMETDYRRFERIRRTLRRELAEFNQKELS